ncbi:aldo/keto reductase family oxidoreductase [Paucibacter sp. DJ2R-2]|uniref:aldo/keto reductase n=1 Tax=Paucibacter sp. DJ2R-2 TaxID=2893558 RepID=UPI0021E43A46|nr:aldo/keto reductase [Paucibacter sp. DJ2R-2]MCV2422601.1 aldo/keto reductase [Paucibacter sp. DJ4R-1]MCV2438799.1 aldo/keto reductase [Paucibacter sp. DJ2R-2]
MTPTPLPLNHFLPGSSRLVLGCMSLGGPWDAQDIGEADIAQAHAALEAAQSIGITVFDHADIYKRGRAERCFGALLRRQPSLRDGIILQSKCGIRFADDAGPGRYDLSAEHIIASVQASLERLGTEYLDLLLLHRPDPLMEPEEIAEAFRLLQSRGQVRHFGVSNMQTSQMRWLQRALDQPLVANQLEMSLGKLDWLAQDASFNDGQSGAALPWAGTLQHCQAEGVQLQAWSPLAQGRFSGAAAADDRIAQAGTALVRELANQHQVAPESIVLAWLLRHPAGIQPVIGSSQPERIRACGAATQVQLSREDWYRLFVCARGQALP